MEGPRELHLSEEARALTAAFQEMLAWEEFSWVEWALAPLELAAYEDELHDQGCDLARGGDRVVTSPLQAILAGWWIVCGCIQGGRVLDDWVAAERLAASELTQLRTITERLAATEDVTRALPLTLRGLHLAASSLHADHPLLPPAAHAFRACVREQLGGALAGRLDAVAAALSAPRGRGRQPLAELHQALQAPQLHPARPDTLLVCSRRLAASAPQSLAPLLVEILTPGVDAGVLAARLLPSPLAGSCAASEGAMLLHLPALPSPEEIELALALLEGALPSPAELREALQAAADALA